MRGHPPLKILVLDWKYIINACRFYFYKELSRQTEVIFYPFFNMNRRIIPIDIPHRRYLEFPLYYHYRRMLLPGYLRALRKLVQNENPDVIYFNERFANFVNYKTIGCDSALKVIHMYDPPRTDHSKLMNFIEFNQIPLAFYENPAWIEDLPEDLQKEPLTWSVDTRIFKENNHPKKHDVVSSGVVSKHYPVRYEIKDMLDNKNVNGLYLKYPHFAPLLGRNLNLDKYFREYANLLSSGKIFIFYNGIKGRTVAKYVEGLASGSLMLAPYPKGGNLYHLEPDKNFVNINEENFKDKIQYYLEDENERIKITKLGIKTANKYLKVQDSVTRFIKTLDGAI